MNLNVLFAFLVYFIALMAIGVVSYRRSNTATDFIVGGRSLNFWVTALSAHASDMSSWLFMAYPGVVFLQGGMGIWLAIGLLLGMWACWQFVAPKLRTETERTGCLTISSYLGERFGDKLGVLKTIGALLSILFFTAYVSAGLVGIGYLFESVLGYDRIFGMTVGIVVVSVYTLVGGYYSICWVDLWQALFLLVMIVLVPLVALGEVTVWEGGLSLSMVPEEGWGSLIQILFGILGWGLGYFGQLHILSKFMGIKDPEEMKKSKRVGLTWQVITLVAATAVGLIGYSYFQGHLDNPELVFVLMVKDLFHPFLAGLILSGVLAATISTMDSQILVLVSVLSEDIYHRFFRPQAKQKERVWFTRLCVLLVGVGAFSLALFSGSTVMGLVFYSWSGLGATFGPLILMALHSKRITLPGAVFGMVFGGVVASIWPLVKPLLPIEVPALIPGFVLNVILIYLVSWATTPKRVKGSA